MGDDVWSVDDDGYLLRSGHLVRLTAGPGVRLSESDDIASLRAALARDELRRECDRLREALGNRDACVRCGDVLIAEMWPRCEACPPFCDECQAEGPCDDDCPNNWRTPPEEDRHE